VFRKPTVLVIGAVRAVPMTSRQRSTSLSRYAAKQLTRRTSPQRSNAPPLERTRSSSLSNVSAHRDSIQLMHFFNDKASIPTLA
jgi:hypothetical protein